MYKKTCYERYISPHMPTNHSLGARNLVLNGTGSLKLLHLYGNFAIVVTISCRAQTGMFEPSKGSYMPVCTLRLQCTHHVYVHNLGEIFMDRGV